MGYLDYTDEWVRALTRQRRAERREELARTPTIRFSARDLGPDRRDKAAARAWRIRQWQGGRRWCEYCGVKMIFRQGHERTMTVDHREAWRGGFGGLDGPLNWLVACWLCNHRKGVMAEGEFRALLAAD